MQHTESTAICRRDVHRHTPASASHPVLPVDCTAVDANDAVDVFFLKMRDGVGYDSYGDTVRLEISGQSLCQSPLA